jgi:hypothetical protein
MAEQLEVSAEQQRTKLWRHVDRTTIEALLRRGKSSWWIAAWLEERYPLEGDDGSEHERAAQHKRWQLSTKTIDRYREQFMPEHSPGIELVDSGLEDIVGRTLPAPPLPQSEFDVIEMGVKVSQQNLARQLEADEKLGMLQSTTLEANRDMISAASKSIEAKSSLGLPGYQKAPEHQIIDQTNTNKNLSVELHGVVDKRTGEVRPSDPSKLEVLKELLAAGPEKTREIIQAATVAAGATVAADEPDPEEDVFDAEVVDG